jgi:hypothetical protein
MAGTPTRVCVLVFMLLTGLALGAAPAVARAAPSGSPAARYPVGSPGMSVAITIAQRYWGADACGGVVTLSWSTADPPSINARAGWFNPVDFYAAPELNHDCSIVFNANAWLPWPRFCTVVVHEWGHLTGHPHSADPNDVMAPVMRAPLPVCAAVPDPASARPTARSASTRSGDRLVESRAQLAQ